MSRNLVAKAARTKRRRSDVLTLIDKSTRENAGSKSDHFLQRMVERKAPWPLVQEAVSTAVIEHLERDRFHNNWKYRLWALMPDGSSVTVVVAIDEKQTLFFVTVFKSTPKMQGRRTLHFLFMYWDTRLPTPHDIFLLSGHCHRNRGHFVPALLNNRVIAA